MRTTRGLVRAIVGLVCLAVASVAAAQIPDDRLPARPIPVEFMQLVTEPGVIVLSAEQVQEAVTWAHDFDAWQKWADRWFNKRQPGFLSGSVERSKRPDPPVWLADVCELFADDDRLSHACELVDQWRQDPLKPKSLQTVAAAGIQKEEPTKS